MYLAKVFFEYIESSMYSNRFGLPWSQDKYMKGNGSFVGGFFDFPYTRDIEMPKRCKKLSKSFAKWCKLCYHVHIGCLEVPLWNETEQWL